MKNRTMVHANSILNVYYFKMHDFLENCIYFLENWYFSGNSACFALKNLKKKIASQPTCLHKNAFKPFAHRAFPSLQAYISLHKAYIKLRVFGVKHVFFEVFIGR
jgi:hypothetical protein